MGETEFWESLGDPTEQGSSTAAESVRAPNYGTPHSVLPGSRVAAASYQDSQGRYLCVYWQDEKGI